MQPTYKIEADNTDITHVVRQHFSELSVKDSSNLDTDSFTLVLEDSNEQIAWPSKGVTLKVWLGYDNELHYKGGFIVAEFDHDSVPDHLTIYCTAADLSTIGGQKKSRYWGEASLGDIISDIAAEHELIPAASSLLAEISVPEFAAAQAA